MSDGIYNEFDTEASIGANSEWIVAFPTRYYYTDRSDVALLPFTARSQSRAVNLIQGCEVVSPSLWDRDELPTLLFDTDPSIPPQCNVTQTGSCAPFCQPPPECDVYKRFCGSVSAFTFQQDAVNLTGAATSIFGSRGALNRSLHVGGRAVDRGHARVTFPTVYSGAPLGAHTLTSLDGDVYSGLPAIGFASSNYVNGNAQPGKLANYSAATRHRRSVSIVGS